MKIRELIESKLNNARLDLENGHYSNKDKLIGNIEAYQDLLALIPTPRTEQEVLKEFEKLGHEVEKRKSYNNENDIIDLFNKKQAKRILILVNKKLIDCHDTLIGISAEITIEEHKLLNELFAIWGWI